MTETSDLEDVAQRYKSATDVLDTVRTEMQETAVALLQQDGVKQADVARVTGWSREHLRRLKEKAELESLRRKVDELSATKKPSPAVATPRQQVTQALRKPVPSISPKVLALPRERVKELADLARDHYPDWVEEIQREYPHPRGPDLDLLIVHLGHQKGFKIPELDEPSATDRADRPVTDEEAATFAALARSKADEMQTKKLDQEAAKASDGNKDFAVMHAALDMELLTNDEVYGNRPAGSEEATG